MLVRNYLILLRILMLKKKVKIYTENIDNISKEKYEKTI